MNDNYATITPEIRTFLEGILQDAEMITLDEEMKEGMIQELYERLDKYLASVMVDKLPADQVEVFIAMNQEKKSPSEIEEFLKEKLPNAQDVFADAFMNFRDLYLNNVSAAKNTNKEGEGPVDSTSSDK